MVGQQVNPKHQSLERLERNILGVALMSATDQEEFAAKAKPEFFSIPRHRTIAAVICEIVNSGRVCDIILAVDALRKRQVLEDVGGAYYLTNLTSETSGYAPNYDYWLLVLRERYAARLVQSECDRAKVRLDEGKDVFDVLEDLTRLEDTITVGLKSAHHISEIGESEIDLLSNLAAKRKMALEAGEKFTVGIPTGFWTLDQNMGGWHAPDMVVLAGRPGMGKTAFALQAAMYPASQGVPVAVFSLEMGNSQLWQRMAASACGIKVSQLRRAELSEEEIQRMSDWAKSHSQHPIYFNDTPGLKLSELRGHLKRMVREQGIKFYVLDYLQLMQGEGRSRSDVDEITQLSKGIAQLNKELGIPGLILSQLSRANEKRGGMMRPRASDLRGSGSIEQDAATIILLHRPEYYGQMIDDHGNSTKGLCEIIFEKNRFGPVTIDKLRFQAEYTRFSDWDSAVARVESNGHHEGPGVPF